MSMDNVHPVQVTCLYILLYILVTKSFHLAHRKIANIIF